MENFQDGAVGSLIIKVQGKTINEIKLPAKCTFIIGRGNNVDYQIRSGGLSREHCQIKDCGTHLELKDLNSLNGTFVNNKKITTAKIETDDIIQIGPINISVKTIYDNQELESNENLKQHEKFLSFINKENKNLQTKKTREIKQASNDNTFNITDLQCEFPEGKCIECDKYLAADDFKEHFAIFKEEKLYCLECFCEKGEEYPVLAGYKIIKKVGGVGMGDVYEAIQLSMERPVAVKILKGLESANEQQKKRFFREAKIGGRLNHPNIVGFIDTGRIETIHFITMEFIYGVDIKKIIANKGAIPYKTAMKIAHCIALALDFANTRFKIVHRDIKPENILINYDNVVKLTDFGLAKNFEKAGISEITKSKTGIGTLFYMSPEQIVNAKFVDHRADIYSLGATLYEMITGVKPFTDNQMMRLVNKIRNEEPTPIKKIKPEISDHICHFISKSMAKNPEDRFQTTKALLKELEVYLD